MIGILGYIGTIVYNEITNTSIVDDVQEFVSNITVSSGGIDESLKTPQILETTAETISPYDEKIDYSNSTVDKYLYNQLNEYSKIIYNAMESNKENMKTGTYEINLGAEFSSLLSESNGEELLGEYYQSAIEAYTYDNPDVFYIEFSKLYLNIETTVRGNKKTYKVFLNAGNNTEIKPLRRAANYSGGTHSGAFTLQKSKYGVCFCRLLNLRCTKNPAGKLLVHLPDF